MSTVTTPEAAPAPLTLDDFFVGDASSDLQVTGEEKQIELSDTALRLDDWALRRGKDVLADSELMRKVFSAPEGDVMKLRGEERKTFNDLAKQTADFHAAAFEPSPELVDACKNERLHRYMKNLLETPEFKALHNETQLDDTASEFAAASFAKAWVAHSAEAPKEGFAEEMASMLACGTALEEAREEVKNLRDAQDALGLDRNNLGATFKRVKNSKRLREICQLAGRYRRFAQARQRRKVLHGRDDVVGVVLDGDVGRMLPHELAQLDDPDLELDVLRRLVERGVMCREYRGIEPKAAGPIVVVVDESGSMNGDPINTAKAMALALAWVARSQKRYCCLVGFAGATEGNFLVIPPGSNDQESLMQWLEHFYSGGTDMDVPCDVLPKRWGELGCPKGKTDIIVITDAICRIPETLQKSFNAWKQAEQVKMISLVINSAPGDLASVSDQVHRVRSLGLEEAAVGEALSI